MDIQSIVLYAFAGLLVMSGTIMSVVNLPGIWLVLLGYVLSGFASSWEIFTPVLVLAVGGGCVVSSVLDNVLSLALSKKFGATWWGLAGAFVGSIVGLLISGIAGLLMGSFVGAYIAELLIMKRAISESLKSGAGAVVGWLLGIVMKFTIAAGLAVLWVVLLI